MGHGLIRANEINYEDRGDPGGCRPVLASLFLVSRREADGHVLSGCNQFRTVRRKPVEREETGTRGRERRRREKDRRLAEGLTDTWPLNGANLRAPAVTLLIR